MANYYCKYCGAHANNVSTLTSSGCYRHPNGAYKGKHVLYEGSEKKNYTCKYCGANASSISQLTSSGCYRHPDGAYKGKHEAAL